MPIFIGRVIKLYTLGKKLSFISLANQGNILDFVYEQPKCKLHFGDFLKIKAEIKYNTEKQKNELRIQELLDIKKINESDQNGFFKKNFNINRYEKLSLRMYVESEIHNFFKTHKYKLVNSPSLVGEWTTGQTGSFKVDFYPNQNRYLTISTILHHYLMMSLGFNSIYEVATLFRKENPSSDKRLAEFTNIVVNRMDVNNEAIRTIFEKMLIFIHKKIRNLNCKTLNIPQTIKFEKISFNELLTAAGIKQLSGHQLNKTIKNYLNKHFDSFVWITNFPENTRPFYVKSKNGICQDCQLWYRGKNFIAAGGDVETNVNILKIKIQQEGKKLEKFYHLLDTLSTGIFKLSGMDLGIERFLAIFVGGKSADYTFFPVFQNCLNF